MRKKKFRIKKENKMRDSEMYRLLERVERPVVRLQRNEEEVSRQIISLRIQLNAIINTFRLILPLRWLYSFFYKMEWKKYSRQMKQRQRLIQKHIKKQKRKKNKK
jgi:hypothetical protein